MPSDLTSLPQAIDPGKAQAPITAAEIPAEDVRPTDESVLKRVLQDVQAAEQYINTKSLPTIWEDYDNLYRAYVRQVAWPGNPDKKRSSLGMPIVLQAIEDVIPQIFMGFFSEKQPFTIDPVGKTTKEAARGATGIINWAIKQSEFKEEIRKALKSCLLYGFLVCKYGWKVDQKRVVTYERPTPPASIPSGLGDVTVDTKESDEIKKKVEFKEIWKPVFQHVPLKMVLFDSTLADHDVRHAKWVCAQWFISANDVLCLADNPDYKNVPTLEQLRELMTKQKGSATDSMQQSKQATWREYQAQPANEAPQADPLDNPIEVLEFETDEDIITVLGRSVVIRNEDNEHGEKSYLSSAFIDVPGSAYGFGIAFLLRSEQKLQQGVVNSWADNLALSLNRPYQRIGVANGGTQSIGIAPGLVRNEQNELKPLEVADVSAVAMTAIEASEARAGKRVGLNASDVPPQAFRTGSGVQSLTGAIAQKLQYFIEIFSYQVFIPALEALLQMCKDHLKPSEVREILSDELATAFDGSVMDIYNGKFSFDVLASTKLAARKAVANLIPIFVQLFSSEPVQESLQTQGKKVDYAVLVEQATEIAGLSVEELIVDMTDEDKQRAQQSNPAVLAAQAKAQAQQADQQNKLQQIDAKTDGSIAGTVVRSALKNTENNSALESKIGEMLSNG